MIPKPARLPSILLLSALLTVGAALAAPAPSEGETVSQKAAKGEDKSTEAAKAPVLTEECKKQLEAARKDPEAKVEKTCLEALAAAKKKAGAGYDPGKVEGLEGLGKAEGEDGEYGTFEDIFGAFGLFKASEAYRSGDETPPPAESGPEKKTEPPKRSKG